MGSIYITTDETDNPITKFGGSWVQIKDVFLLGAGDIYENGANGGSADAVVVKHKHIPAARIDAFSDSLDYELTLTNVNYGGLISYYQMETRQSNQGMRTSTGYEGEDGTGKNMPPYLVVYIWKRLAD